MSIAAVQGGAGLPLEVLSMIEELGRELSKESRDAARDAADTALRKGREEADQLREQAGKMLCGAIVGGLVSAASVYVQSLGAQELSGSGLSTAQVEHGKALLTLGSGGAQLGEALNGSFQALAKNDEADAREAAAQKEAANQLATSKQAERADAQKVLDRARETYSQLLSLEHASIMAAIGRV